MRNAFEKIKEIYRLTNKPNDFLFNQWVCRPPAAVMVYVLKNRRITPNQVTFLSLLMALFANAALLFLRNHPGLVLSAIFLQFAFILDCTDGQLARIRGTSSTLGGLLDFLMDEIKAVTLVAAISGRLAWQSAERNDTRLALCWLGLGLLGVVMVAIGIALTTFMRRPEYLQISQPKESSPSPLKKTFLQKLISACEWVGKSVINYPSWFWLPAFAGQIEWFLLPYLTAHFLYLGRSSLSVLLLLGKSSPKGTSLVFVK